MFRPVICCVIFLNCLTWALEVSRPCTPQIIQNCTPGRFVPCGSTANHRVLHARDATKCQVPAGRLRPQQLVVVQFFSGPPGLRGKCMEILLQVGECWGMDSEGDSYDCPWPLRSWLPVGKVRFVLQLVPKLPETWCLQLLLQFQRGGRQIHTADGLSTLQRLTTYSHAWQTRLVHFLVLILKPKFVKKSERSWTMLCIMCIAPVQGHSSHSLKLLATPWSFQAPCGRSWKQTTKRARGANTMLAFGILIFKICNPITVCLTLTIHGS